MFYFLFHFPLAVVHLLTDLIFGRDGHLDPAAREWFSQPRPAIERENIKPTLFTVIPTRHLWPGIGMFPWGPPYDEQIIPRVGDLYQWQRVPYSAAVFPSLRHNVEEGVETLVNMIRATPGKFALMGHQQGAAVVSLVYEEIRSGSLQDRRGDLLTGVCFGNPMREQGHTFPGGPDPGGHGVLPAQYRLSGTEDLWWEFANPRDLATCNGDDDDGDLYTEIAEAFWTGDLVGLPPAGIFPPWPLPLVVLNAVAVLIPGFPHPHRLHDLVHALSDYLIFSHHVHTPHSDYSGYRPIAGNTMTCWDLAAQHLRTVAQSLPAGPLTNKVTTEVISVTFKVPVSVSEVSVEVLRVPCVMEIWYRDRSNNWRPVLDVVRLPLRVAISHSDVKSWYKFHSRCYPIVAKQIQFRLKRVRDLTLENIPYVVGLRNALIKRNVFDRHGAAMPFEDEQDVFGNVITKYIRDWDATKAVDDKPFTFWRSEPMPDPMAVVSMYLDVRANDGSSQLIDKLYLDPVYTNQHLNIYYSLDDFEGTRKLSPVSLPPYEDENTLWRPGVGRVDISTGVGVGLYRWDMSVGPLVDKPAWIGVEWLPDFDAGDGPPQNPVLLRAIQPITPGVQFKPSLYYDVGAGEFVLEFTDGSDTRTYTASLTRTFVKDESLRIVVGWRYNPDTVFISVRDYTGTEIARLEDNPTTLPRLVSFDGQLELYAFRGTMRAIVIKLDDYVSTATAFQVSPAYYVDPDPVIPDVNGTVPSTSLDNTVYAASWTTQQDGRGGMHDSAFADKEWIPIWRDYITQKGMMYFPQMISAKYLKLEFYNLTEEPYPVYESGIEVRYRIFPVAVIRLASLKIKYKGSMGLVGLTSFISTAPQLAVNWVNQNSIMAALGSVIGPQAPPVVVNSGPGFITQTVPGLGSTMVADNSRLELASPYVYRREVLNPYILAEDKFSLIIKAEGLQVLESYPGVDWDEIRAANPGSISHVRSVGAVPIRGSDWWVFPGHQLKIPASVMMRLTLTSTVTERKLTREHRLRFNTTCIHRYEWRTLKRDAAIAYFAGVREVIPFTSTFIGGEDREYFDFTQYDPVQWVMTNTRQIPEGPVTVDAKTYYIQNNAFRDTGHLSNWIQEGNNWSCDTTTGHWAWGTARCDQENLEDNDLLSTLVYPSEGEVIDFSVWVKWDDVVAVDGETPIELGVVTYLDGVEVDRPSFAALGFADWAANTSSNNLWTQLTGTWEVPAGIDSFRVRLGVRPTMSTGTVWFDNPDLADADFASATIAKSLETASSYSQVRVDFRDSGLVRSDSMWADIIPDSQSIEDTQLAYYVSTTVVPGGMWSDTVKAWGGSDVEWGSPYSLVGITVDPERRYQGKRVIHFRRDAGAGEAGIRVRQWNNFVPLGLYRLGCAYYKAVDNDNEMTIRLRRLSDGVFIYEETIQPKIGRWEEFTTVFNEIPDSDDQEYEVTLTLTGDDEDHLYLSDLFTEIANIRYFIRLGGEGGFTHEVSDLRYADGKAYVSTSTPVTEMLLSMAILSPKAYAYGARIQPMYLR